jgi:L-threonylcarbamoyladenylate synthase
MNNQILLKAVKALSNGDLVVYPTDTLYGIGADIFNENAIKKVFKVKKRPFNEPLSVAVSDINEMNKIAYVDKKTQILAKLFLPGDLTLILKKRNIISDFITSNLDKIAIRVPNHKIALDLISKFGPITATSANIHKKETPGIISDISMQFKKGDISVYIDAGKIMGKPSTIIDTTCDEPKIIREGNLSKKQILDAIKNG